MPGTLSRNFGIFLLSGQATSEEISLRDHDFFVLKNQRRWVGQKCDYIFSLNKKPRGGSARVRSSWYPTGKGIKQTLVLAVKTPRASVPNKGAPLARLFIATARRILALRSFWRLLAARIHQRFANLHICEREGDKRCAIRLHCAKIGRVEQWARGCLSVCHWLGQLLGSKR